MNRGTQENPYDILIIGGGIQGAGVARDASLRGLSVMLCEKDDFGHATSSSSSKLIHGGLRYLERLELHLVHESLNERSRLYKTAKQVVRPLSLALPVFKDSRRPAWMYRIGLFLYDLLALGHPLPKHRKISKEKVSEDFPFLKTETLTDCLEYSDCRTDDFKMVILNLQDAIEHGAKCLNYCKVIKVERQSDGIFSIQLEGLKNLVFAKTIVNAGGPWLDEISRQTRGKENQRIAHGKGIHLVFESNYELKKAIFLEIPNEKRIFFVLPWKTKILVGTTDTPYIKSLEEISSNQEDVAYLLNALKKYIPIEKLKQMKLVGTMSGVRPLVFKNTKNTKELSRGYRIKEREKNIWSIEGGKYTVYRKIGELVSDQICNRLNVDHKCKTYERCLPGSPEESWDDFYVNEIERCQKETKCEKDLSNYWIEQYGTQWKILIDQGGDQKLRRFHKNYFLTEAEILYCIRFEFAKTIEDIICRRSFIWFSENSGEEVMNDVADILQHERNLSNEEIEIQKEKYLQKLNLKNEFIRSVEL